MRPPIRNFRRSAAAAVAVLATLGAHAFGAGYAQTNLAADQPGVALIHDPELVGPGGSRSTQQARSGSLVAPPPAAA
jgi:hypothetical protein